MKRKQGISLIVLVLTIVVIVILATAVILSISNNNPIENANKAKFLNDIKSFEEDYTLRMLNSYFDLDEERDITIADLTEDEEYRKKLTIKDDKIYLVESEVTEKEIKWASEVGIECISLPWDGNSIDTAWYDNNKNKTEFEISTASELAGLAKLVNEGTEQFDGKTINLMNNIDLNNQEWEPIGNYDVANGGMVNDFAGTFVGNGHEISHMHITESSSYYIGLFGDICGATIEGITVKDSYISSDAVDIVGAIVGQADINSSNNTPSQIINCASINNTIKGTGTLGGIVGDLYASDALYCYNASTVENTSTASKGNWTQIGFGGDRAGGICGGCIDGTSDIYYCYNTGTIIAKNTRAGGIVGACMNYELVDCYNIGDVSGAAYGEIVAEGEPDIINCYCLDSANAISELCIYDETCSYEVYSIPVDGLKAENLNKCAGAEYIDDINNINKGYPIFSWQK